MEHHNHRFPGKSHWKMLLALLLALPLLKSCICQFNPAAHPEWIEQGPGPIHVGQVEGITNRPVAGAVKSIAPHPENADVIYIGTVNGGVWKTENAMAESPTWTPLTDHLPSLAIGSICFSPLDQTHQTLFAGTGSFSSGARRGGPAVGIYKTTSAGFVWEMIGKDLAGIPINILVAANIAGSIPNEPVLLAATGNGVFRSTDAGATFRNVLNGNVTALVADPNNALRFFAAVRNQGIFSSADTGATWQATANIDHPMTMNPTSIKLAMSRNVGALNNSHLYAAISLDEQAAVFRSIDAGASWQSLYSPYTYEGPPFLGSNVGPFPGKQSNIHFSFAADPDQLNIVYLGGDRQPGVATSSGTLDISGRIFLGNARRAANAIWESLMGSGAGNSSPHADSRDIKFDANGDLLEADDGGIYRLRNPTSPLVRRWQSLNGNLRIPSFIPSPTIRTTT